MAHDTGVIAGKVGSCQDLTKKPRQETERGFLFYFHPCSYKALALNSCSIHSYLFLSFKVTTAQFQLLSVSL